MIHAQVSTSNYLELPPTGKSFMYESMNILKNAYVVQAFLQTAPCLHLSCETA